MAGEAPHMCPPLANTANQKHTVPYVPEKFVTLASTVDDTVCPFKWEHLVKKLWERRIGFPNPHDSPLQHSCFSTRHASYQHFKRWDKKPRWKRGMSYSRWGSSVCHVSLQILLKKAGKAARLPVCVRERADSNTSGIWHPLPGITSLRRFLLLIPS